MLKKIFSYLKSNALPIIAIIILIINLVRTEALSAKVDKISAEFKQSPEEINSVITLRDKIEYLETRIRSIESIVDDINSNVEDVQATLEDR